MHKDDVDEYVANAQAMGLTVETMPTAKRRREAKSGSSGSGEASDSKRRTLPDGTPMKSSISNRGSGMTLEGLDGVLSK